jgi:hypothetical protein
MSENNRYFVDELHYKGWSVKIADWLDLSNPDDPSRPVVAHFVYSNRKYAKGKLRTKVRRQTVMVVIETRVLTLMGTLRKPFLPVLAFFQTFSRNMNAVGEYVRRGTVT